MVACLQQGENTVASKTPSKTKLGTVMHAMKALFPAIDAARFWDVERAIG
jgi:hypothetical protein